jgi:hypothetical protein
MGQYMARSEAKAAGSQGLILSSFTQHLLYRRSHGPFLPEADQEFNTVAREPASKAGDNDELPPCHVPPALHVSIVVVGMLAR